jgi:hypothetical protein
MTATLKPHRAKMGTGFGSEAHLLRFLGRHRKRFDAEVRAALRASAIEWLDFEFDPSAAWQDRELTGLDFIDDPAIVRGWKAVWPQSGTPHSWDAVGRACYGELQEWMLVEAKANLQELKSPCSAKAGSPSRRQIEAALAATRAGLGVADDADWMNGYYQYANRLAVLHFLNSHHVPARLLYVYFVGDRGDRLRRCPQSESEWLPALESRRKHLGLAADHPLADRVHELFLHVWRV